MKTVKFEDVIKDLPYEELVKQDNTLVDKQILNSYFGGGSIGTTNVAGEVSVVAGDLRSNNYVAGVSGWMMDYLGNLYANSGTFRGDITGASGTFSGTISAILGLIGGWTIGTTSITAIGGTPTALDTGAISPGTMTNLAFGSLAAWDTPNNAKVADSTYTTSFRTFAEIGSSSTNKLQATNFGFAIPAGATINGIVVKIVRKASHQDGGWNNVYDNGGAGNPSHSGIGIIKNGSRIGTDKRSAAPFSTSNETITYGTSSDVWGTTLTVSDINASDFGIEYFAEICTDASTTVTAYIDHINITVYYTTALTAGSVGMSSEVTTGDDIRFWAGDATPASAPFRVYESGLVIGSNLAHSGGTVGGVAVANVAFVSTSGADAVPADLSVSATGITTALDGTTSAYVTLTWTAISSDTFDHYLIRYKKASYTYYQYIPSNTNTITIDGLVPNTSYNFGLASINKYGTSSAYSSDISQTTASDTAAPATVTAGTATGGIQYNIVEWTHNTDSDLASYNIYRHTSNDSGAASLIGNCRTNYFIDGGRTGGTPYYYWVKAVDTSGNVSTSFSTEVHATPRNVVTADSNIACQGWTQTCVFSVTDTDTVAWAAGTFTAANGTSYSIDAGNTGNMVARTYIYLDIAVSTTAYQTTTTATSAVGDGKVLIAVAQNNTTEAIFQVFGGVGGANWKGSDIVAGSVTTNEIAANTIVAGNIAAGTITATEIGTNAITSANILSIAASKVLIDGVVYLSNWQKAGDLTKIDGGSISANSVTTTQLNFTPVQSTNVIASINASAEGIAITAENLSIGAATTFAAGYDPTAKVTTFLQDGIPTSIAAGDIWIDTNDSNKMYRATSAGNDEIAAGEWVLVSTQGITIFAQDGIPTSLAAGDLWYDTNDGNKSYRAAIAGADQITAGEWELVTDTNKLNALGGAYDSAASGARVRIFPDANTGIQVIDDAAADVFKVLVGGANVGDVIIGNWAGGQGIFYDKSANTTTFAGALSAPTGTLGAITTAQISVGTTGYVLGGQTDYNTGTGFFLGYSGSAYKFSIGNSSDKYLRWTGLAFETSGISLSKTMRAWMAGQAITAGDAVAITAYAQSDGGITYDNKYATYQASGTSMTQGFAVGNNTNRALIVFVLNQSTPSGVTYGGTAMTQIDTQQLSLYSAYLTSYLLIAPATGSNNVVVSGLSNDRTAISISSYYNVSQSGQPAAHNGNNAGSQGISLDITSVNPCSLIVTGGGGVGTSSQSGMNTYKYEGYTGFNFIESHDALYGIGSFDSGIINAAQAVTMEINFNESGSTYCAICNVCLDPVTAPTTGIKKASASTQLNMMTSFIGFADANISLGATGDVVLAGEATGLSGLVAGTKYYIQNTAGTLGTSAGTNTIVAGMGLSTSTILIKNVS